MKIYDCFHTPTYKQIRDEEGSYEVQSGYILVAQAQREDGLIADYIYKAGHDRFHYVYATEERAESHAQEIKRHGEICLLYWDLVNLYNPNELPDYVTNPHRPEYN